MIHETILAIITASAISASFCPIIIPFLYKLKFGQQVRDDGPESHLRKQGTPTMGGLIILSSTTIASVFYIPSYPKIIPVLFVTVGFGIIGLLDDYIKIMMERSEGLKPTQRLAGWFTIIGIFAWYLLNGGEVGTDTLIPFTGGFDGGSFLSLGVFFVPTPLFIILGTDNGVNFADGLDGLCIGATILVAIFPAVVTIGEGTSTSPVTGAMVGNLLGLLPFNVHPAKVSMGDTGPLALGGFVATSCYMMRMSLFIPVIRLIYLAEVLSAIIQVTYLKRTGSKRILKMAPIRHRFGLCGWPETRVVAVFATVTAILYMVAYLGL